jgi:hypothetical protein
MRWIRWLRPAEADPASDDRDDIEALWIANTPAWRNELEDFWQRERD